MATLESESELPPGYVALTLGPDDYQEITRQRCPDGTFKTVSRALLIAKATQEGKIEMTPAMIEAGAEEIAKLDLGAPWGRLAEEIAGAVFRRMVLEQRRLAPPSEPGVAYPPRQHHGIV